MPNVMEITNTLFDSANTVAGVISDYTHNEAKLSTDNKRIVFKDALNKKMDDIRSSSNSEEWPAKINEFFEQTKSDMMNPDSPYYCKNNLQGQMFNQILNEAKVDVDNKISGLVWEADREKSLLNTQHSCDLLRQTKSGQESLDAQDELWRNEMEVKHISRTQYEQQKQLNYYTEYQNMYTITAQKSVTDAIKQNKTPEQFYEDVKRVQPKLRLTDADGMEIVTDMTKIDEQLKKDIYSMFNAAQRDAWQQTETEFAKLWDRVQDQRTEEGRNLVKKEGRLRLDQLQDTGLISSDQLIKWTNYFKLQDYMDGGTTTESQAKKAIEKLDPKDAMQFFVNSIKRGDESDLGGPATVYDSYDLFKNKCMTELEKLNPDYSYSDLEQACPTIMEYFEYAKKNLPPMMQDVVSSAENMLKLAVNTKDNPNAYEEEINGVMDIVYDILFEQNISDFDASQQKEVKERVARFINSKYGSMLQKQKDYKWLKDETGIEAITDYKKGVFGQEKSLAQAMQARDNNQDIYYQDMYGNKKFFMGEDVQKGLTLIENEEKQMIADAIKYKTGKEINPDEIPSAYQSDGIHDVNARKVYTVDGNDYYFTSKDGKHVTMYEKKTGEAEFHESMTEKENKKLDVNTGIEQWKNGDKNARPPISIRNSQAAGGGEMSAEEWANASDSFKSNIIKKWIKEDPQAAMNWISKHSK